jgi:hypothetical protein
VAGHCLVIFRFDIFVGMFGFGGYSVGQKIKEFG